MTAINGQSIRDTADAQASERRLGLLRQIATAGGSVAPVADPAAREGYAYPLRGDDVERDLAVLAQRNYLEPRFFDRVSLCPKCNGHHLNVREICPGCRRARLSAEGLLHHFRCGYVGIPAEFVQTSDGSYICPKCNGRMHHLGTQYDRLGKAFRCHVCAVISENPPSEAVCLGCGAHTPAGDLISTEVFSYALTSRGGAAVRAGSLLDDPNDLVTVADSPVFNRPVTVEFLTHYGKCLQEFGTVFSVLLVECDASAIDRLSEDALTQYLTRLRAAVREPDVAGQLADARFIVLLPQTKRRAAEALGRRVQAALAPDAPFTVAAIEITAPKQLTQLIAGRNTLVRSA